MVGEEYEEDQYGNRVKVRDICEYVTHQREEVHQKEDICESARNLLSTASGRSLTSEDGIADAYVTVPEIDMRVLVGRYSGGQLMLYRVGNHGLRTPSGPGTCTAGYPRLCSG